jgi:DNA-binding transcriptional ArsR family regulator
MAVVWPRPQRLLPPKLVQALEAVQAGKVEQALKLIASGQGEDALTADAATLVRGLAAHERGETDRALRLLHPLLRSHDESIAMAATLASVELRAQTRGFAGVLPWLRRARRRAADDAVALTLDAEHARVQLLRRGALGTAEVAGLRQRLRRKHPAAVHASLHLLAAEQAMLAGNLDEASRSERLARPYVGSAQLAALRRRHDELDALLNGDPVAEVEDWERPRRPMSRAAIAEMESEPWRLWVDRRYRRVRHRPAARAGVQTLHFAAARRDWELLDAMLNEPRRRIGWSRALSVLSIANEGALRERAARLTELFEGLEAGSCLRETRRGIGVVEARYVVVHPIDALAVLQQLVLASLAHRPGATARRLARDLDVAPRTLLRHLGILRERGWVRLVGGGREARYHVI